MITSNRTMKSKGLQIVVLLLSWSFRSSLSLMPTTLKPPKTQDGDETTGETAVYKIVGISSGPQYLPASYVKTFSRWIIEEEETGSYKLLPIDTAGECSTKQQEKVDTISIQPTVNFLIQGGVPVYVFVGLVVVSNNQNKENTQQKRHLSLTKEDLHNNYLAQQWITFDKTAHPNFRIQVVWGPGDGTADDQSAGIVDPPTVKKAVEQLGYTLSTTENKDLSSGFHIVSLPLQMDMSSSPNFQQNSKDNAAILLTCLALVEPNAREILKLDDTATVAVSKLQVDAVTVLSMA